MKYTFYLFTIFLFSCNSSDNTILVSNSGQAQGSYYHIKYMSEMGKDFHFQIDSILKDIDSSLSIYKEYSLISRLNNGEKLKTDSLFNDVFLAAKQIYIQTEGNFDCSVRPLAREWGFYKDRFSQELEVDSIKISKILKNIGFDKIQLSNDSLVLPKGVSIDFNSIAQGYTVDLIGKYLALNNVEDYLIEVGGELLSKGKNSDGNLWRVGVDKPFDNIDVSDRFQFILDLEDKALATSGNYRNFYEKNGVKYSHIINPFTGFPAQNRLLSVTVIHDNCMFADAYATAFMVMGVKKTKKFLQRLDGKLEVYLVFTDQKGDWNTYISPRMKERIIN